jgi:hypothetical protein
MQDGSVDAKPDPDPTFLFNADPDPDHIPNFTHVGISAKVLTFIRSSVSPHCFIFLGSVSDVDPDPQH